MISRPFFNYYDPSAIQQLNVKTTNAQSMKRVSSSPPPTPTPPLPIREEKRKMTVEVVLTRENVSDEIGKKNQQQQKRRRDFFLFVFFLQFSMKNVVYFFASKHACLVVCL